MARYVINLSENQKNKVKNVIKRAPRNEEQLKRIFYKLEKVLGFSNVKIYVDYPDATATYNDAEIDMEFEYLSSNFRKHKHNPKGCDLIICWKDDDCTLSTKVLELATIADNWLDEKENAILFAQRYSHGLAFDGKKSIRKEQKIRQLMDKYDFDDKDVLAHLLRINRSSLQTYSLSELAEWQGGPLECQKRDIDITNLTVEGLEGKQGIHPAVLCYGCENKNSCQIGETTEFGYIILLDIDGNNPRKIRLSSLPINDKQILSSLTMPPFNLFNDLKFRKG